MRRGGHRVGSQRQSHFREIAGGLSVKTAGTGEVDWRAFFATLRELNYTGDFVIEREAGNQRVVDIRSATEVVARMGDGVA